jgi:hypothetical protein
MKSDVDLKGISFRRVLYFFILTDFFCVFMCRLDLVPYLCWLLPTVSRCK